MKSGNRRSLQPGNQTAQENYNNSPSGFGGFANGVLQEITPSSTPSRHANVQGGHESSIVINLGKNNFQESVNSTRQEEDFFTHLEKQNFSPGQSSQKKYGIEIMSLNDNSMDDSKRDKKQISIYQTDSASQLTDRQESPDLLKPQSLNFKLGEQSTVKRSTEVITENVAKFHLGEEQVQDAATANQKNGVPINVIARVRPQIPNELRHPVCIEVVDDSIVNGHKTQIVVRQGFGAAKQEQKLFSFEKVLDPVSTQQKVFDDCDGLNLCNAFVNGQNCTIFVYGPTSTGKTFTMQGNAEDIIHGKVESNATAVLNKTAQLASNNASPEQSYISQLDESVMTNDFEFKHLTPTKRQKMMQNNSTMKRGGRQASSSFHMPRLSNGRHEDSPSHGPGKPTIHKVARDMMIESRDKGIIQRVLDNIYEKFDRRKDLCTNCEIKISFLEIYKEHVTDLLEGHQQPKANQLKKGHARGHSSTLCIPGLDQNDIQSQRSQSSVGTRRKKASTFYGGEQDLEDAVNQKRSRMEAGRCASPSGGVDLNTSTMTHRQKGPPKYSSFRDVLGQKKQYTVKENAIKGVYVQNLSEIVCNTAEQAYHCLLDGLMRKRMSQTVRNTSSSRSHTIFQIKMYIKPESSNQLLLPQYQLPGETSEPKLVAKFSLIDLAGSERIMEAEKNAERIDEAKFINKSLSALGNVVAALRTQAKQASHQQKDANLDQSMVSRRGLGGGGDSRRSSFHSTMNNMKSPPSFAEMKHHGTMPRRVSHYESKPAATTHVPFRDSKLTHILKDCLGSNSFTHLIICLSPSYLCLAESISTLAFTKNAKAVRQNIVENVQFKSDLVQRNLAATQQKREAQTTRAGPASRSLLSQMAGGNDEDEAMLKEILGELGGSQFSGMGVKQLFQLTLEQLRKFKDDQQDFKKQIAELKTAMDQDLRNPRTLEIMTHAQTESVGSHLQRKNSFYSANDKASHATPSGEGKDGFTGLQQDYNLLNYASANVERNQNIRNQTLKSISEEDHSASIASPNDNSNKTNLLGYRDKNGNNPYHADSRLFKPPSFKNASTTSIMTFAGGENNFTNGLARKDVNCRNSQVSLLGKGMSNNISGKFQDHQNSCETGGGHTKDHNDESVTVLDTEPGDVCDETTPCGCAHQGRQSIIPESNLQRLQSKPQVHTMRHLLQKTMERFIRRRLELERSFLKRPQKHQRGGQQQTSKRHLRQKSSDAAMTSLAMENADRTKRANEKFGNRYSQLEPQSYITKSNQFTAQNQMPRGYSAKNIIQGQATPKRDENNDHFTEIDKAGMAYFMPKLLKSSSCPSYLPENKPTQSGIITPTNQDSQLEVKTLKKLHEDDRGVLADMGNKEEREMKVIQQWSQQMSEICSSTSQDYQCTNELVVSSYQSTPKRHHKGVKGENNRLVNDYQQNIKQPSASYRDLKTILVGKKGESAQNGSMLPRFEQSQGGNNFNLFDSSNSNSINQSLVQSQSQKIINSNIGGGFKAGNQNNPGHLKQHNNSNIKVIQIRSNNTNTVAPQRLERSNSGSRTSSHRQRARARSSAKKLSGGIASASRGSQGSMQSEIMVVEEVNDNEISSDVFQRMRQTNDKQLVSSIRTDSISNGMGMGPLIDDNGKLPQHTGSLVEPQQQQLVEPVVGQSYSKPTSLSSIHQQDGNSTFTTSSLMKPLFQKQRSAGQSNVSNFAPRVIGSTQQQNKQRIAQKTLISDLNKVHKTPAMGNKTEVMKHYSVQPKKIKDHAALLKSAGGSYLDKKQRERVQANSFHSASNASFHRPTSAIKMGVPMTQHATKKKLNRAPGVVQQKLGSSHLSSLLSPTSTASGQHKSKANNMSIGSGVQFSTPGPKSPPTVGQSPYNNTLKSSKVQVLSASTSSAMLQSQLAGYSNMSAPSKMPSRKTSQPAFKSPMKPNKPGVHAYKPSQPLAGVRPMQHP